MSRQPPIDLDAEATVLSACLLKRDAIDEVADFLKTEHFFSVANAIIFGAILELAERSEPVDPTTVATFLRNQGKLADVGGAAYIVQVTDASPAVHNVQAHARAVRDLWRLRKLIAECQGIAAQGYGAVGDIQGYLDQAEARVRLVTEAEKSQALGTLGDGLNEMFSSFRDMAAGASRVVKTGFAAYDGITGGWDDGDLVIWAGRPAMGKTASICAVAMNLASEVVGPDRLPKNEVLIFSQEMRRVQIATRMACAEAAVDYQRVKAGTLTGDEFVRLSQAADFLKRLPIHIDDTPGMTPIAMRSKARRVATAAERNGRRLAMVVTDHAQIANVEGTAGKGASRSRELGKMSGMFKATAKEMGAVWVLLSQLGREVEKRPNKRPIMADLRESGDLEQDADNVTFVYRDEYYSQQAGKPPRPEMRGVAEFIVSKQRNGPTSTAFVKFDGAYARFGDLEQARVEALREEAA